MKRFFTLRSALTVNTLLVAAVPLLVVGFVTLHLIEKDIENKLGRQNMALAKTACAEAQDYLDHLSDHLRYIALTMEAKKLVTGDKIDLLLNTEIRSSKFFQAIRIVDRHGRLHQMASVLSNRKSSSGEINSLNIYQEVLRTGQKSWSETFTASGTGEPSVTLGMPAGDSVILGTFSLSGLYEIVKRVTEENGYAYIVNRKGQLIAHPDHSLAERQFSIADLPIVRNGQQGNFGTYRYFFRGTERQGSIYQVSETGWLIAAAQPYAEAYAPVRQIRLIILGGMVLTVLLALLSGVWSLRRLLAPLDVLGRNVKAIAGGNYTLDPPPSGFKELDELSSDVQIMADAVNEREERLALQYEEIAMAEEELRQQVDEYFKSQDELCKTNNALQAIINASPLAVITLDLQGVVTLWNPEAERIFGWSAAEATGCFAPYVTSEHLPEFNQIMDELLATGRIIQRDIQRTRKGGVVIDLRNSSAVLRDGSGKITGIMALYADISEQKKAEQALRQSEEFFRLTFDLSTIGAAVIDQNYNLRRVNEELCRLTGYTEEELLKMNVSEINYPGDFAPCVGSAERLLRGEISHYRTEKRYLHKDGRLVWVNLSVRLLHDAAKKETVFFSQIEDITDRKQAEEEIRTLNSDLERRVAERTAQLEAVNQEVASFSYSVSHDLRAPLRHIDGFGQALLEEYGGSLDATARDYLQRVTSASKRMGNLIDDLMKLSRVTREDLKREETDLVPMVREATEELQRMQPERNVEVRVPAQVQVNADPRLMKVVIDNLVGNAWKYTGKREQAVIEFDLQKKDGAQVLCVRDNGAGFDMTYANKLFSPFQRLHRDDEFEGTGIGLATVQRIINRHGGKIWAEGTPNEGAAFYFTV